MSDNCARCGSERAFSSFSPPFAWLDYLREERGLAPPIGVIRAPLCVECETEFDTVQETWRELGSPPLNEQSGIAAEVRDRLDDLDVDALDDDMR